MSISIRKGNGAYEFRLNGVVCSPDEICEHVNKLEQENAKLEDALHRIYGVTCDPRERYIDDAAVYAAIANIRAIALGTRRNK